VSFGYRLQLKGNPKEAVWTLAVKYFAVARLAAAQSGLPFAGNCVIFTTLVKSGGFDLISSND
jgi:hypothetical protein